MNSGLSSDTVVKRNETVPFTPIDDELLALDIQRGFVYSLNETGQRVWDAIAEPAQIRDICRRLMESYEVDAALCERGVIALLGELCDVGLVGIVDAPR